MNPRDEVRHAQSYTALYTKLDAECDQQAMVAGRSTDDNMATLTVVRRRQVFSTTDGCLFKLKFHGSSFPRSIIETSSRGCR